MNSELYYVANYRMPTERAHGLQVAKMCEALARAGVRVSLILPRRGESNQTIFEYYGLRAHFPVQYLPVWNLTGRIPVIGFWLQSFTFAVSAVWYVHTRKYHGTVYSRDQFSLWMLSVFTRNLLLYEMHTKPRRLTFWHRMLFKRVLGIIAVSDGLARALAHAGIDRGKITVAHDGVDTSIFAVERPQGEARARLQLQSDKVVVAYAGSLMPWKGVYTLACAAQMLEDTYQVVAVGGTEKDVRIFSRYLEQNNIQRFSLRPRTSHQGVAEYLQGADVLVLPNSAREDISRLYTSPLKFFEYLASGRPVVASDVPSLREIGDLFPGVFFCAPDDPRALAQCIRNVKPGHFIRDLSHYSWQARAQKIIEVISLYARFA